MILRSLTVVLLLARPLLALETSADDVSFDLKNGICVLSGDARVVYDKGKKFSSKFKADKITVFYEKSEHTKPKLVKATGRVRFDSGDFVVTADSCECDMKKVVFLDNVLIKNENLGEIKADVATYVLGAKLIDVTSKGRVTLNVSAKATKRLAGKFVKKAQK
jgi:lipopolysaccharide export system protein LptA